MKQIVYEYFQGLFNVSVSAGEYSLLPQLFSQLGCEDLAGLSGTVTELEIKHSLFAIGGLKTLGLNGFLAIFYQNFWDLCSSDIISVVKDCFITASLPEHLIDTLIALVPKAERPTSMPQLRPISLCNTLYKVVSKIHVARLRPLMSKLVSPTQISKGKKGFVAWKIDLSKAYDHLSWNFIREVFWEVGIRGRILELLMICISYVKYKAVHNASVTQAKVMKQCLDDFCNLSGQRVSFEKSMICVSPNTCFDLARQLAFISGSPLTDFLGIYLGVPLIHKRVTKATYFEIVDKKTAWMNQALLAKTGWRLLQNDQGLLSQILNANCGPLQSHALIDLFEEMLQLNAGFVMPSEPHKLILQYAMDWFTSCKPMLSSLKKCVVQVHCHAPLPSFVKLNTNRSGKSDSGAIGIGGLIRNSTRDCITGFAVNQGVGSTLEAEFWGIF
ncbi:unnamed protein product [Prunus armeniaca]